MDALIESMDQAFKSECLVYRSMEDTDADKAFLHQLNSDPINLGLASLSLFRLKTAAESAADMAATLKSCLLAVFICLPPAATSESSAPDVSKSIKTEVKTETKPKPIGMLVLSKPRENMEQSRSTMLGINVIKCHQNKGYGSEALNWALDWAFKYANMHRVNLGTPGFNERAIAVYKKVGFVHEGTARESLFFNGRYWDVQDFSMLEQEWRAIRGIE